MCWSNKTHYKQLGWGAQAIVKNVYLDLKDWYKASWEKTNIIISNKDLLDNKLILDTRWLISTNLKQSLERDLKNNKFNWLACLSVISWRAKADTQQERGNWQTIFNSDAIKRDSGLKKAKQLW